LDRLRAHPGIVSAGGVNILPQMDTNGSVSFDLEGSAQNTGAEPPMTRFRIATPGYFESLGIAVLRGRSFQESDVAAGGVVVSRSMADRFWPRIDPVGRRLRLRLSPTGQMPWLPVVGVVEDVRQWINSPAEPTLYWANLRQPEYAFVVRTSVDPTSLADAVTQIVRQIDPRQPVFDMHSMQERLDRSQQITYERFRTKVMAGFGCAALLLAGIGIYGVVRHSVIQRTPEFGIRMALGASSRQIFAIVLLQSLRSTVVGSILGFLGSFALGRSLSSVLYGGGGFQPLIMAGVALVLGLLATAAALGPARLAARVDPMQSFRSE
jgi:putative ABC transport system permease protein